jgi:hypothetical protein
MHSPILAPVVALVAWSLLILVWMLLTRLPALRAAGISISKVRGSRPGQLDGVVPDSAQWVAHNYNHLMEQPTLFYAICISLSVLGAGGGLNLQLAWAYVGFRVLHSLVQGTTNVIKYRLALFLLSSGVLAALTFHAAMLVFH